jgi:hypothetical protein
MTKYFKQCQFRSGNIHTMAWIEEEGAKVGNTMIFKDTDDPRRWEVTLVFDIRLTEDAVKERERDYLKQRKASDI